MISFLLPSPFPPVFSVLFSFSLASLRMPLPPFPLQLFLSPLSSFLAISYFSFSMLIISFSSFSSFAFHVFISCISVLLLPFINFILFSSSLFISFLLLFQSLRACTTGALVVGGISYPAITIDWCSHSPEVRLPFSYVQQ